MPVVQSPADPLADLPLAAERATASSAGTPIAATSATFVAAAPVAAAPVAVAPTATTTAAPTFTTTLSSAAAATTSTAAPRQIVRLPARLASAGLRAEQLAGIIGVRAADLSIDFVDPSGLPALFAAQSAPEMSFLRQPSVVVTEMPAGSWSPGLPGSAAVAPPPSSPSSGASVAGTPTEELERIERRDAVARAVTAPLLARASAGFRLTPVEWALVATFPSSATALQLAAARRSTQFLQPESPRASVGA